ncbi:YcaO-like family protein [Roseobacter sp.]|uniref:YcaO-like family protein n=1 Tax=Roseobacter sp. TaxID=1907202 RepID=UPI0025E01D6A|nr:YcaO-like family protein [Roseobacter sp.]
MPFNAWVENSFMTAPGSDLARMAALFTPHWFEAPDLPVHLVAVVPGDAAMALSGFPAAALPVTGRVASGRGLTRADALRRALGEAAELVSCCRNGDADTGRAAPVGGRLDRTEVLRFSQAQYAAHKSWNERWGDEDLWPGAPGRDAMWHEGVDLLSGRVVCAPSDLVWIGGDGVSALNPSGSEGCASGRDHDAAVAAALAELFESDAIGRWWWGGIRAAALPLSLLEEVPDLLRAFGARERETTLMLLAAPQAPHCVAAVSSAPDGGAVACGFAARTDLRAAALAAALELADSEFRIRMAQHHGPEHPLTPWIAGMSRADPRFTPDGAADVPRTTAGLSDCCAARGGTFAVFDMTRAQFGAPALRIIAPGLVSQRPRFLNLPSADALLPALTGTAGATGRQAALPLLV